MSRETDLAWAAGLFDGEGSTMFLATKDSERGITVKRIQIEIGQVLSNRYILDRFHSIVGVGYIYVKNRTYRPNEKPFCSYKINKFEQIQYVICLLWKNLSPCKRNQAKHALSSFRNFRSQKISRQMDINKMINDEEVSIEDFR
jgi:hypothetical protein